LAERRLPKPKVAGSTPVVRLRADAVVLVRTFSLRRLWAGREERAFRLPHILPLSPPPAARVARLDGVRAIAALSVICFHVWLYRVDRPHGARSELLDQVLFEANGGLICFFVLSGYLLYGAFARAALTGAAGVAIGPYLLRRAARIVPAAWVCGAVSLAVYWAVDYHTITPSASELPAYALFAQNYSLSTMGRLNPVLWTLNVEVAFYATLPLIGWAALRLGPQRMRAQLALVIAIIAVSPAWDLLALERGWDAIANRALPAYLGAFGLGMLVALWGQQRRTATRSRGQLGPWTTGALLAGATLFVVADAMCRENGWLVPDAVLGERFLSPAVQVELLGHLGAAAGFALLIAAAALGSGPAVGWLGWRPFAALGTVSYGLYLWHLPLLLSARHAGLLPAALGLRLLVVLAITVPVAAASWRWVERPCIERGAVRPSKRRRVAQRADTPAQAVS
jgi:peptidoglycan/LPS O-acetylase OafA/YrhL